MGNGARHFLTAVAIMATVGSTVACGAGRTAAPTQTAGLDCAAQVRFQGATFTAYRLTHQHARKIGLATPTCSGKNLDGGHRVAVWSFPGQPAAKVLVRQGSIRGRFAVYVADSLSLDERSRVLRTVNDGR